jgi:hypothetical protein
MRDGGTKRQKISIINEYCFKNFKGKREICASIHDKDIQLWAKIKAKELGLEFKAYLSYVNRFKQKYGISSRKIRF